MNRVSLSGWLAARPLLSTVSGMEVALLRLLVVASPVPPACEEVLAEVDCFAFLETAGYLVHYGMPGDWLSVEGRLYQDRFVMESGRSERRLCVHIDAATLATPIPTPDWRTLPTGSPSARPANRRHAPAGASPRDGKESAR